MLDARAELLQQLSLPEVDGLDDVGPLRIPAGEGLIAQILQKGSGEDRRFQCLGHGVGGHEKALEKTAVEAQGGADLAPQTRHRQPEGRRFHQFGAACHIPPRGGQAAAGILDEGTGQQVAPRLPLLREFPVAVVHHAGGIRVHPVHQVDDFIDGLHIQGGPGGIAPAALDENLLYARIGCRSLNGGPVRFAGGKQLHGFEADAVAAQAAGLVVMDAQGAPKGIIGQARGAEKGIPRAQGGENGAGDGVGAVHEAQAHQGALRAENLGPDLFQGLPAQVVIAVAGGTGEAGLADPVIPEGCHDPPGAVLRNGVDLPEAGADAFHRILCELF